GPAIDEAANSSHQQNYKSLLQQHCQQVELPMPSYRVLDEQGPDHAKAFKVAAEVGADIFDSAWGNSKKRAEQAAAFNALVKLGVLHAKDAIGCDVANLSDADAD
ncbi:MAG: putative dsRNA-binding protein, partial [Planctomycetota bacterium]